MDSLERGNMAEPVRPDLLPGTLYMLILRTLAAGPLHGYAIVKRVKEASRDGIQIEDGSLYPALNRMLVKGWLKAEWGISENNRKARFYHLTPEGRKQLNREAEEFERMVSAIQLVMRTA
jgi:PadR family transcriptional regulator PadR